MSFSSISSSLFLRRVYKRIFFCMLIWLCVGFIFFSMHSSINMSQKNAQYLNSASFYEYIDSNPNINSPQFNYLNNSSSRVGAHVNLIRGLMQNDYNSGYSENNNLALAYQENTIDLTNRKNLEKIQIINLDDGENKAPFKSNNLHASAPVAILKHQLFNNKLIYNLMPNIGNVNSLNENQILSKFIELSKTNHQSASQQDLSAKSINSYVNHNHNLPVSEWSKNKLKRGKQKSNNNQKKCFIQYPDLYDLLFNNVFWQVLRGMASNSHLNTTESSSASNVTSNTNHNSSNYKSNNNITNNHNSTNTTTSTTINSNLNKNSSNTLNSSTFKNQLYPISYYLYNAYYDDRALAGPLAQVRILAMIDRIKPPPVYCLFWYSNLTQPIIVSATYTYAWYFKWGNYNDGNLQPFLINCQIPKKSKKIHTILDVPDSVTLSLDKCAKPMNNLRVLNDRPKTKKKFAVCVKGLDFLNEDLSVRLVEWIELLNLVGAEKIFLYELETHPNISKVINYYTQKGLVELTKLTLPGEQPNIPGFRHLYLKNKITKKRQNELIPYNDCLYRNLNAFKYLVLLDIDEIIMPIQHENWLQLMNEVEKLESKKYNTTRASYNVRNVYFLDDLTKLGSEGHNASNLQNSQAGVPIYMHMLNHVVRSRNYTKPGQYVKCFHNIERIVSLHNHFPLNCFGSCTTYSINTNLAHLQHYRKDCVGPLHNACNKDFRAHTVRDTTIWKYKDNLIARVTDTLLNLGFF